VDEIEVVVAHSERATLRVGDVFLKIDADAARLEQEVAAMRLAPLPTPEVLWHKPQVLALVALRGEPLARLVEPSTASPEAWALAGAAVRTLHDAPVPPWAGRTTDQLAARLEEQCRWFDAHGVLPAGVLRRNRELAATVLRQWTPAFIHGDCQVDHFFVEGDQLTGVIDWSEAAPGDALFDLAVLTLGNEKHLDDVIAGYGRDVDRDLIRGWWTWRCLTAVPWLAEHGYGQPEEFPEWALLRAQ
jgi:aminoglycoside phosphotransferase (APT) family kinase protein